MKKRIQNFNRVELKGFENYEVNRGKVGLGGSGGGFRGEIWL